MILAHTFCGVMSYSTCCCRPLRMVFSVIVSKSLAARIESMIVMKEASTSGGTRLRAMISCLYVCSFLAGNYTRHG